MSTHTVHVGEVERSGRGEEGDGGRQRRGLGEERCGWGGGREKGRGNRRQGEEGLGLEKCEEWEG